MHINIWHPLVLGGIVCGYFALVLVLCWLWHGICLLSEPDEERADDDRRAA